MRLERVGLETEPAPNPGDVKDHASGLNYDLDAYG